MTKYWIVVDNAHQGPFTAEELAEKKLSGDTYAWYPGLPKWTQLKDIPELAEVIFVEEIEESPAEQTVTSADEVVNDISSNTAANEPAAPQTPPVAPPPPPERAYAPAYPLQMDYSETEVKKCPPSYLAWSIITTILFFLPLGIVAIIYSARVNGLWNSGQEERAKKASETAAWFSNIAFVVGLIWIPFSTAFSMLI